MGLVRNIGGVVAGIVASQLVVLGAELIGTTLYTAPDLTALDEAEIAAWMDSVPLSLKLVVVLGWALAAFAGPWLALRITDRAWSGWVVSGLFLVACIANLVMLPHPLWMAIAGVVLPVAGGWLAQRLHHKPYPGEPLLG